MSFIIFFDDGGVLNDNKIRGAHWKRLVGEYYSMLFGGDPEIWGEANHKLITSLFDIFWRDGKEKFGDYNSFYNDFKKKMVNGMFKETGNEIPKNINFIKVFNGATQYVIPKVRSAIPGIIDSIKELHSKGFTLYTAAGAVSNEMKMYLEAMGIIGYFKEFYGPDLINTWKSGTAFYRAIFKHSGVDPIKAIIVDDQPRFLENALEVGANVIQACITGEHKPRFPFYVENMKELPIIIDNLIKTHNL
jgi:beta-phosphoglucomutase-like phosphatase (HAD superfamily)